MVALGERGFQVECLTEGSFAVTDMIDSGIKVHQLHFPSKASPIEFCIAIAKLRKLLLANDFHLVNCHNRNSSIIARIACWFAGVPINLYTAHGFYFQDHQSPLAHKLAEIFEGMLSKISTYILSQSDEDTIRMTTKGWIADDKIRTIGNGIDAQRFSPNRKTPDSSGHLTVCAMGRLVAGKGFEDILRAIAASRHQESIEFLFIGGNIAQDISPSSTEFNQLIRSLGLEEQVRVTGMIDNVEDFLNSAEIFVHPSYAEGMPRSLLEAMSTGLPCIATRIRGAREIIEPGVNGLIFEPHDWKELAAAIDQLFEDKALRQTLGANARKTVLDGFQEKDYVERQVEAIEDLLRMQGLI